VITILYLNARSIFNKLNNISHICSDINPTIIAVTESWAKDHFDSELNLPGYQLVGRADRCGIYKKRGGGVLGFF
jgi:hypothetical protein